MISIKDCKGFLLYLVWKYEFKDCGVFKFFSLGICILKNVSLYKCINYMCVVYFFFYVSKCDIVEVIMVNLGMWGLILLFLKYEIKG